MSLVRAVAVALITTLFAGSALAQGKWTKLAPFPEPSEELLGASAGGKLYVFAGLAPGWKPKALVYEYDSAADKWAKKKPMALPSHHVAFAEHKGKIYAFGGFVHAHKARLAGGGFPRRQDLRDRRRGGGSRPERCAPGAAAHFGRNRRGIRSG